MHGTRRLWTWLAIICVLSFATLLLQTGYTAKPWARELTKPGFADRRNLFALCKEKRTPKGVRC